MLVRRSRGGYNCGVEVPHFEDAANARTGSAGKRAYMAWALARAINNFRPVVPRGMVTAGT